MKLMIGLICVLIAGSAAARSAQERVQERMFCEDVAKQTVGYWQARHNLKSDATSVAAGRAKIATAFETYFEPASHPTSKKMRMDIVRNLFEQPLIDSPERAYKMGYAACKDR